MVFTYYSIMELLDVVVLRCKIWHDHYGQDNLTWSVLDNKRPLITGSGTAAFHRTSGVCARGVILIWRMGEWVYFSEMLNYLITCLVPCALASECWKNDLCYYPDTKPIGVPFLDIPRKDARLPSCPAACLSNDGCVAATVEPLEEICHLYEESASFEMAQAPGVNVWLSQAAGVPCIKVSNTTRHDIRWDMSKFICFCTSLVHI